MFGRSTCEYKKVFIYIPASLLWFSIKQFSIERMIRYWETRFHARQFGASHAAQTLAYDDTAGNDLVCERMINEVQSTVFSNMAVS